MMNNYEKYDPYNKLFDKYCDHFDADIRDYAIARELIVVDKIINNDIDEIKKYVKNNPKIATIKLLPDKNGNNMHKIPYKFAKSDGMFELLIPYHLSSCEIYHCLVMAIDKNFVNSVKKILEHGFSLNGKSGEKEHFEDAIEKENAEVVENYINCGIHQFVDNELHQKGRKLLFKNAIEKENAEVVENYIDSGIDKIVDEELLKKGYELLVKSAEKNYLEKMTQH